MILPLLLYEILIFLISVLTYGISALVTFHTGIFLYSLLGLNLFLIFSPSLVVIFLLSLILSIWIIRLITPKLKEGTYDAPTSKMFYVWTIHFTLNRMVSIQPIRNLILYSVNLRYLLFTALGAKIAYGTSISADVDLNDLPMLNIGKNCVIGACSFITGHFINKGKITFGKITIEDNVNIGGFTHISPSVFIGKNSWVGAEARISPLVKISSDCTVDSGAFIPAGYRMEKGENFSNSHNKI